MGHDILSYYPDRKARDRRKVWDFCFIIEVEHKYWNYPTITTANYPTSASTPHSGISVEKDRPEPPKIIYQVGFGGISALLYLQSQHASICGEATHWPQVLVSQCSHKNVSRSPSMGAISIRTDPRRYVSWNLSRIQEDKWNDILIIVSEHYEYYALWISHWPSVFQAWVKYFRNLWLHP